MRPTTNDLARREIGDVPVVADGRDRLLLTWCTAYTLLWIFEGAVRKWGGAGLGDALYVSRDVLTLGIFSVILAGLGRSRLVMVWSPIFFSIALLLLGTLQVWVSRVGATVMFFGLRTYVIILFAIVLFFLCAEPGPMLKRLCKLILASAPVQAAIAVIQVSSPAASAWNRISSGEQIDFYTAGDVVRASGTFTSPSGLTGYAALLIAVSLGISMSRDGLLASRLWGWTGMTSALLLVCLSGSRGLVLAAIVITAGMILLGTIKSEIRIPRVGVLVAACIVGLSIVSRVFPVVVDAFLERVSSAGGSEETTRRVVLDGLGYLDIKSGFRGLGDGLGAHTNGGIALGSPYPWIENELVRWVAELGWVGIALVMVRQILFVGLTFVIMRRLGKSGGLFNWLLLLSILPAGFAGSLTSQPSHQGVFVLTMGLIILQMKRENAANG